MLVLAVITDRVDALPVANEDMVTFKRKVRR